MWVSIDILGHLQKTKETGLWTSEKKYRIQEYKSPEIFKKNCTLAKTYSTVLTPLHK